MKIEPKISNLLVFLLLSWLLVGGSLYFLYNSRLQEFIAYQQEISDQGLKVIASEIAEYFERRRHLLSLYINRHSSELQVLGQNPEDMAAVQLVDTSLRAYFTEFVGFSLAAGDGKALLLEGVNSPGTLCRADITNFAQGRQMNEVFIHSDPDPEQFHIDILGKVDDLYPGEEGVLMVKLGTALLQRLISNRQPYNHNFYLVRRTSDNRYLIELTKSGTWPMLARSEYLAEEEIKKAFSRRAIEGSRWLVIDFVSEQYMAEVERGYRDSAFLIGMLYLLLSAAFLIIYWHGERRKVAQDCQIRQLNETLEHLLKQRTDELEQSQQMLSYQSSHDSLTGLINRREFEIRLNQAITLATSNPDQRAVVLYVDLDHIKIVNETCGLVAGDELLKQLSKSLYGLLRRQDTLARIGGDEFGVLLSNCGLVQAGLIANTIREQVGNQGFVWEDRHFDISASIGAAEINETTEDVSDLLRQADSACYAAKEKGRNKVHLYQPDDTMFQNRRSEMYWQGEAMRLINRGGIVLFGQQIQSVGGSGTSNWYEVLVRLRDDQGELVYPDMFIPALEQYGGIEKLDVEIVRLAIDYLSRHPGMRLNINLSGKSVGSRDILQEITALIDRYHVNPRNLVFEITETVAMVNVRQSRWFIDGIKSLGCQMALDDFGSGMSSFSYLKNLDVDYVKLDGSFVRNLHQDSVHHEMVKSINGVTRVMGRHCIAEFVENQEVVEALKQIGVAYAQGYHIHKPQALEEILLGKQQGGRVVDFPLS